MNTSTNESEVLAGRFDGIASRFSQQIRNGETPDVEDYVTQHQDLEDQIRRLFPILEMMESDGSSPDSWADVDSVESVINEYVDRPQIDQLGHFKILKTIGRGGMGIVYLAEQRSLGRQVALKLLPHSANFDIRKRQRL